MTFKILIEAKYFLSRQLEKIKCLYLIFSFLILSDAVAQYGPPPKVEYNIDWNERLAPNLGVAAHDTSLLGDNIDLHTGRLSFEHVDVSIPGNSKLPVEIRRRLNPSQWRGHEFHDWQLAVPSITTNINGYDFVRGTRWGKSRCSQPLVDSIPHSNSPKI